MKFLSTILGSERDRMNRRRRTLEMNLHRLEEKTFLLEMELEEARRQKAKTMDELRSMLPTRLVSTISMSSADDCSFETNSEPADNYRTSTSCSKPKVDKKLDVIRQEEKERVEWLRKQRENESKLIKY